MRLRGKVALVTGASRGIGKIIAEHLGEEGSSVVLNYAHSEEGVQDAAEYIRRLGSEVMICKANLASLPEMSVMFDRAIERFGRLDVLVNNAAIAPRNPFLEVTEDVWNEVINVNLKAAFFSAVAATREMIKVGKGRIINISSVHAVASMSDFAVYSASKGGLNALTRQLALDLAPFKITVNAVAPGRVKVEKSAYDAAMAGREIPCGRVGDGRDISSVVVFLACDASDWLTGQIITVDGGTTRRLFLDVDRLPSQT